MEKVTEEEEELVCRVCRCESTVEAPLLQPCRCEGSVGLVHEACLTQWLSFSRKDSCELCKYKYRFTPRYAPGTPERLPLRTLGSAALLWLGSLWRPLLLYGNATFVWLFVFPLATTWLYRVWLHIGTALSGRLLALRLSVPQLLLQDWLSGACITAFLLVCMFVNTGFADFVAIEARNQANMLRRAEIAAPTLIESLTISQRRDHSNPGAAADRELRANHPRDAEAARAQGFWQRVHDYMAGGWAACTGVFIRLFGGTFLDVFQLAALPVFCFYVAEQLFWNLLRGVGTKDNVPLLEPLRIAVLISVGVGAFVFVFIPSLFTVEARATFATRVAKVGDLSIERNIRRVARARFVFHVWRNVCVLMFVVACGFHLAVATSWRPLRIAVKSAVQLIDPVFPMRLELRRVDTVDLLNHMHFIRDALNESGAEVHDWYSPTSNLGEKGIFVNGSISDPRGAILFLYRKSLDLLNSSTVVGLDELLVSLNLHPTTDAEALAKAASDEVAYILWHLFFATASGGWMLPFRKRTLPLPVSAVIAPKDRRRRRHRRRRDRLVASTSNHVDAPLVQATQDGQADKVPHRPLQHLSRSGVAVMPFANPFAILSLSDSDDEVHVEGPSTSAGVPLGVLDTPVARKMSSASVCVAPSDTHAEDWQLVRPRLRNTRLTHTSGLPVSPLNNTNVLDDVPASDAVNAAIVNAMTDIERRDSKITDVLDALPVAAAVDPATNVADARIAHDPRVVPAAEIRHAPAAAQRRFEARRQMLQAALGIDAGAALGQVARGLDGPEAGGGLMDDVVQVAAADLDVNDAMQIDDLLGLRGDQWTVCARAFVGLSLVFVGIGVYINVPQFPLRVGVGVATRLWSLSSTTAGFALEEQQDGMKIDDMFLPIVQARDIFVVLYGYSAVALFLIALSLLNTWTKMIIVAVLDCMIVLRRHVIFQRLLDNLLLQRAFPVDLRLYLANAFPRKKIRGLVDFIPHGFGVITVGRLVGLLTLRRVLLQIIAGLMADLLSLSLVPSNLSHRAGWAMHHPISFVLCHWLLGVLVLAVTSTVMLQMRENLRYPLVARWTRQHTGTVAQMLREAMDRTMLQHVWGSCIMLILCAFFVLGLVIAPSILASGAGARMQLLPSPINGLISPSLGVFSPDFWSTNASRPVKLGIPDVPSSVNTPSFQYNEINKFNSTPVSAAAVYSSLLSAALHGDLALGTITVLSIQCLRVTSELSTQGTLQTTQLNSTFLSQSSVAPSCPPGRVLALRLNVRCRHTPRRRGALLDAIFFSGDDIVRPFAVGSTFLQAINNSSQDTATNYSVVYHNTVTLWRVFVQVWVKFYANAYAYVFGHDRGSESVTPPQVSSLAIDRPIRNISSQDTVAIDDSIVYPVSVFLVSWWRVFVQVWVNFNANAYALVFRHDLGSESVTPPQVSSLAIDRPIRINDSDAVFQKLESQPVFNITVLEGSHEFLILAPSLWRAFALISLEDELSFRGPFPGAAMLSNKSFNECSRGNDTAMSTIPCGMRSEDFFSAHGSGSKETKLASYETSPLHNQDSVSSENNGTHVPMTKRSTAFRSDEILLTRMPVFAFVSLADSNFSAEDLYLRSIEGDSADRAVDESVGHELLARQKHPFVHVWNLRYAGRVELQISVSNVTLSSESGGDASLNLTRLSTFATDTSRANSTVTLTGSRFRAYNSLHMSYALPPSVPTKIDDLTLWWVSASATINALSSTDSRSSPWASVLLSNRAFGGTMQARKTGHPNSSLANAGDLRVGQVIESGPFAGQRICRRSTETISAYFARDSGPDDGHMYDPLAPSSPNQPSSILPGVSLNASTASFRPARSYDSYSMNSNGELFFCGPGTPPAVTFASFVPLPDSALLAHITFPPDSALTSLVGGIRVGIDSASASLARSVAVLQNQDSHLSNGRALPQDLDASIRRVHLEWAWPFVINVTAVFGMLTTQQREALDDANKTIDDCVVWVVKMIPPGVWSFLMSFLSWLQISVMQCITAVAWHMWPDRFRVSYWSLTWHLPFDLAIAVAVVLLGLDAAKALALILQSLWLDFVCPLLDIEDTIRPPREVLAFRAFTVALPGELAGNTLCQNIPGAYAQMRSNTTARLPDELVPPSSSFDITIHRHPDGLPHVGKRPLRPVILTDPLGTLPSGSDEPLLTPFSWLPGQPALHPVLGDMEQQDAKIRVRVAVSAAVIRGVSQRQANRQSPVIGHGVPEGSLTAAFLSSTDTADLRASAAAVGLGSTILPLVMSPSSIHAVADPNSVLRAATLISVFRCPALPLQQCPTLTGRYKSASNLLAAAERRILWLAVPEMWRFDEPDELSRYCDEVRVRHRLALLADDMDASVFDHALQARSRLSQYAVDGSAMERTTTHAISARRGDLQLCLAAYGGGSIELFQSQLHLYGGVPSAGWKIHRGLPYPPWLPRSVGVSLRPSESLRQLLELEAEGGVQDGVDDGEHSQPDNLAESMPGVMTKPLEDNAAVAAERPAVNIEGDCVYFAATELNARGDRPGVHKAAAQALEDICAPVAAAARHNVYSLSVIAGHALAGACASIHHSQCSDLPAALDLPAPLPARICDTVDACSVATRILVRDALSDALEKALLMEDAVSSVHPETVRQVRWFFRSHVEGSILLTRVQKLCRDMLSVAGYETRDAASSVQSRTSAKTQGTAPLHPTGTALNGVLHEGAVSTVADKPSATVHRIELKSGTAQIAIEKGADSAALKRTELALQDALMREIVGSPVVAPDLPPPNGIDPLSLQDAVPSRVLPFIRVWDTCGIASHSHHAWEAAGGSKMLVRESNGQLSAVLPPAPLWGVECAVCGCTPDERGAYARSDWLWVGPARVCSTRCVQEVMLNGGAPPTITSEVNSIVRLVPAAIDLPAPLMPRLPLRRFFSSAASQLSRVRHSAGVRLLAVAAVNCGRITWSSSLVLIRLPLFLVLSWGVAALATALAIFLSLHIGRAALQATHLTMLCTHDFYALVTGFFITFFLSDTMMVAIYGLTNVAAGLVRRYASSCMTLAVTVQDSWRCSVEKQAYARLPITAVPNAKVGPAEQASRLSVFDAVTGFDSSRASVFAHIRHFILRAALWGALPIHRFAVRSGVDVGNMGTVPAYMTLRRARSAVAAAATLLLVLPITIGATVSCITSPAGMASFMVGRAHWQTGESLRSAAVSGKRLEAQIAWGSLVAESVHVTTSSQWAEGEVVSSGLPCSVHLPTDRSVPAYLSSHPNYAGIHAAVNVTRHSLATTLAAALTPVDLDLKQPLLLGSYPVDIMQSPGAGCLLAGEFPPATKDLTGPTATAITVIVKTPVGSLLSTWIVGAHLLSLLAELCFVGAFGSRLQASINLFEWRLIAVLTSRLWFFVLRPVGLSALALCGASAAAVVCVSWSTGYAALAALAPLIEAGKLSLVATSHGVQGSSHLLPTVMIVPGFSGGADDVAQAASVLAGFRSLNGHLCRCIVTALLLAAIWRLLVRFDAADRGIAALKRAFDTWHEWVRAARFQIGRTLVGFSDKDRQRERRARQVLRGLGRPTGSKTGPSGAGAPPA